MKVVLTYPERIESEANQREHWAKKAARVKRQRIGAWAELRSAKAWGNGLLALPIKVKLTRIAPRSLDSDNLQSGFKATRDGVADFFGVDDRDPRIEWSYDQQRGAPKYYAVRIEVAADVGTARAALWMLASDLGKQEGRLLGEFGQELPGDDGSEQP